MYIFNKEVESIVESNNSVFLCIGKCNYIAYFMHKFCIYFGLFLFKISYHIGEFLFVLILDIS